MKTKKKGSVVKDRKKKGSDEVVCEFFGIKIATKNPNLAKVLNTEVSEFMKLDIGEVKGYLTNPDQRDIDSKSYRSYDLNTEETDVDIAIEVGEVMSGDDEGRSKDKTKSGDDEPASVDKLVDEWLDKH